MTILFDGIAYGMLLFILAVGLSVTMGLMNFINLAHGAFAMVGGYLTVVLMQRFDVPFLVCLPIAFAGTALLGAVLERTLYRPMYRKPHLDQVLFSIGLAFMAVASVDYFVGSQQQIMQLPEWLKGRTELGVGTPWELGMGHYRLFIIAVRADIAIPAALAGQGGEAPFHTRALMTAHENLPKALKQNWLWWRLPTWDPPMAASFPGGATIEPSIRLSSATCTRITAKASNSPCWQRIAPRTRICAAWRG